MVTLAIKFCNPAPNNWFDPQLNSSVLLVIPPLYPPVDKDELVETQ